MLVDKPIQASNKPVQTEKRMPETVQKRKIQRLIFFKCRKYTG